MIAERYGPPDFPDAKYGYVRQGTEQRDSKGRVGDVHFKLLASGCESEESPTAFEKRMSEQAKTRNATKAGAARDQTATEVQEIVAAVDKEAATKKRKEVRIDQVSLIITLLILEI